MTVMRLFNSQVAETLLTRAGIPEDGERAVLAEGSSR